MTELERLEYIRESQLYHPPRDYADECDHEDYDLDILIGRAVCTDCGHRWYMNARELKRDEEIRSQPYPDYVTEYPRRGRTITVHGMVLATWVGVAILLASLAIWSAG